MQQDDPPIGPARLSWPRQAWRAQRELPALLRFPVLVPLTFVLVTVLGMTLPLPPGPLCDEGMVLFMEGGCDWGGSNIFFYSKVGLLLVANGAFGFCLVRPPRVLLGFLPHLTLLVAMAWLLRSGADCETYYDHPNGSMGQMCLEMAAFSAWGLALLGALEGRPAWMRVLAVPLWNASHVGIFYAGLTWTPHWTWAHTAFMVGGQLVLASGAWLLQASRRRTASPAPSFGGQLALCGVAGLLLVGLLEGTDWGALPPLLAVLLLWGVLHLLLRRWRFQAWVSGGLALAIVGLVLLGLHLHGRWDHNRAASQMALLQERVRPRLTREKLTFLRAQVRDEDMAASWFRELLEEQGLPPGSEITIFAPLKDGVFLYLSHNRSFSYVDERMLEGPGSTHSLGRGLVRAILDSRGEVVSTAGTVHDEAWDLTSMTRAFVGWPVLDEQGAVLAVIILEQG